MGRFDEPYRHSLDDPDGFWAEAAAEIDWDEPCERVLDDSRAPFYRWFAGGRLNTCHNALDRHVEGGRADQPALIYDSPVTATTATSPTANCAMRLRASRAHSWPKVSGKATASSSTCRWCPRP
jgi:hypothetical protein